MILAFVSRIQKIKIQVTKSDFDGVCIRYYNIDAQFHYNVEYLDFKREMDVIKYLRSFIDDLIEINCVLDIYD